MNGQIKQWGALIVLIMFSQLLNGQQQVPPAQKPADQLTIPPRVLPLPPKDILALLPATPAGWKTDSSLATTQISSWVLTIAQRQIEAPATGAKTGIGGPLAPPMRTTFMLIDTGFDPSAAGAFVEFKPVHQGNLDKAFINSQPVIRTRLSATSESLQILINRRFVLQVQAENQPADAVLNWLRAVPLDRYNVLATATLSALPTQVKVGSVDELNPSNDHESVVTTGSHTGPRPQ